MPTRIKTVKRSSNRVSKARLTAYESEQVGRIAAWKSRPPHPIAEMAKMITLPVSRWAQKVIPDQAVRVAIEKAYDISHMLAGAEDVKRKSGIKDLSEMRKKPLEECDACATQVGLGSQGWATVQGAATGAGGVLTTLLDIPLIFVLSLRTILKIGHCYGYSLETQRDQHFVLGVLITATSATVETRRHRLDQLHELEDLLIHESQEEIVSEEILSLLFQLEIFGEVPGMGTISGALLNLAFIRRVDRTARRVFQERWLRDNGKVGVIAPAPAHERDIASGWSGVVGRAAYSGCYLLGFGAALPTVFLTSVFRPMDNSLANGLRDGAAGASLGAEHVLEWARNETAARLSAPRRRPARALA